MTLTRFSRLLLGVMLPRFMATAGVIALGSEAFGPNWEEFFMAAYSWPVELFSMNWIHYGFQDWVECLLPGVFSDYRWILIDLLCWGTLFLYDRTSNKCLAQDI